MRNMGHKVVMCSLFLLAVLSCRQELKTRVNLHFEGAGVGSEVTLAVGDSVYRTVFDSTFSAVFDLAGEACNGYAEIYNERNWIPVYVEKGKSLEVRRNKQKQLCFRGESAKKNDYLNSAVITGFQLDYKTDEKTFIEAWNKQLGRLYEHLDSMAFDRAFTRLERKRLYYVCCNRLALYPYYHARAIGQQEYMPSEEYYAFTGKMIKEDEAAWELNGYKSAFRNIVQVYGNKGTKGNDPLELLKNEFNYIGNNISDPRLTAYLLDDLLTGYVEQNGVDHLEGLLPVYYTKVDDPAKIARFKELYGHWAKLARGQLAPVFDFCDIKGDTVSFANLKGKYVYIDVWATWCYFCCREIPDLKKLEQQMKDRNIYFVSISLDKDKVAWEKKVREEQLGGVQLCTEGERDFLDAYRIKGIPRFILIDPEGKIKNINMTRPSDPTTFRRLDTLPGM